MRCTFLLIAAVVACVLALPAASSAQMLRNSMANASPAADPEPFGGKASGPRALANLSVVWIERDLDGRLLVKTAFQGRRTLYTSAKPKSGEFLAGDLSVGGSRYAVVIRRLTRKPGTPETAVLRSVTVVTGTPAGPAAELLTCGPGAAVEAGPADDGVLVSGGGCDGGAALSFHPITPTGFGGPVALAAQGRELRAQGRYVAWRQTTAPGVVQIVVWDRVAGAELYRVDGGDVVPGWDLQDDGKLAVQVGSPGGACAVFWTSPADPARHAIPGVCSADRLRIVGDIVAFRAPDSIRVARFDGSNLIAGPSPANHLAEFDFDGRLVVAAWGECAKDYFQISQVAAGFFVPNASARALQTTQGACSAAAKDRVLKVNGKRVTRASLVCPKGCRGTLRLDARPPGAEPFTLTTAAFTGIRSLRLEIPKALIARLGCKSTTVPASETFRVRQRQGTGAFREWTSRVRLVLDRQLCPRRPTR